MRKRPDSTKFEKRIFIWKKKNMPKKEDRWSNNRLAVHFGTTSQAVSKMYQRINKMKLSDLEKEYQEYLKGEL